VKSWPIMTGEFRVAFSRASGVFSVFVADDEAMLKASGFLGANALNIVIAIVVASSPFLFRTAISSPMRILASSVLLKVDVRALLKTVRCFRLG